MEERARNWRGHSCDESDERRDGDCDERGRDEVEREGDENIHATIVGDGTVGFVALDRPKALNALSHALNLNG